MNFVKYGFTSAYETIVSSLPWQGLKAATKKKKYDKICEKKLTTPIEVLCKSHPVEFASYFHYCHSLAFDQRPDYVFVKRVFRELFSREGYEWDFIFDWTILKYQQAQKSKPQQRSSPVSGEGNNRATPMDLDKYQGNLVHGSTEVIDRMRPGNVDSPTIRMQFKPQPGKNLSLDKPLERNLRPKSPVTVKQEKLNSK